MSKISYHERLCKEIHDIYVKKNHDYGNSFGDLYKEIGISYALGHILEKVYRFKTLAKGESPMVKGEEIQDTLLDLANYCLMTYMEIVSEPTEHQSYIAEDAESTLEFLERKGCMPSDDYIQPITYKIGRQLLSGTENTTNNDGE